MSLSTQISANLALLFSTCLLFFSDVLNQRQLRKVSYEKRKSFPLFIYISLLFTGCARCFSKSTRRRGHEEHEGPTKVVRLVRSRDESNEFHEAKLGVQLGGQTISHCSPNVFGTYSSGLFFQHFFGDSVRPWSCAHRNFDEDFCLVRPAQIKCLKPVG